MEYNDYMEEKYNDPGNKGLGRCAMRGSDIITSINERRTDKHCFIKWWRKEEDFLDYDLIDRFVENTVGSEEIGGFELLTLDDMWDEVRRIGGSRVTLVHCTESGDKVKWTHKGKAGISNTVCAFSPESLMQIYDVETRGNAVDS
jgi:hypothetical protein